MMSSSSVYVKLDNDGFDDVEFDTNKTATTGGEKKIIPPAPPIHFPDDDSLKPIGEALFSTSQEYTKPISCEIIGHIPPWIDGTFIRVGPGRFEWGDTKVDHWFDGDAIAHRFTLNNGKVTYQSKFLQTGYHTRNEKYNRVSEPGFGTYAPPDPCANIFRRIAMYFIPNVNLDNTNVNVFEIQGKTYCGTELPWMLEIDKDTLETIKVFNARNTMDTTLATWLAHPHFEPDGTTYFCSTKMFPFKKYQIVKIPPTPRNSPLEGLELMAELEPNSDGAAYFHSFAMTENHIILILNPLFIGNICKILTMNMRHKAIADTMEFRPEQGPRYFDKINYEMKNINFSYEFGQEFPDYVHLFAKFRIINKHSKKELREVRGDPMMYFHVANSYETETEFIVDLCSYKDDAPIRMFYMKNCKNMFKGQTIDPPNLVRYRIPKTEVLKDDPEPYRLPRVYDNGRDNEVLASCELPVYNYDMVNGRDYKYVYGMSGMFRSSDICKVNVKTKETITWNPHDDNIISTNPFFIQRPGGKAEDDGVVVANCSGANGVESFFVVLDARTMKEIGRANMHVEMGMMIHGNFFAKK